LIVGALLVTGACSDDDDEGGFSFGGGEGTEGSVPGQSGDGGGFGGLGDGEETGGLGDGGSGGGEAFGEQSMSTFVANCANFPGASESLCECAWDEISGRVSASEYAAFEEEFLSNPETPLPGWLTDAVAGCS
jgi:hypothetical protein